VIGNLHVTVNVLYNENAAARDNKYNIVNYKFHAYIRKYSFCPRVVHVCKSLPDYKVGYSLGL